MVSPSVTYMIDSIEDAVIVFGVFDGLHLGHRFLIDSARAFAKEYGKRLVALTFDIDPSELFLKDPCKIYSNDERLNMLYGYGIQQVVAIHFNQSFASLSPEAFLETIRNTALPFAIFCGNDIRFGSRASGTIETLLHWCNQHNVILKPFDLLMKDCEPITATRIRHLLQTGDIEQANNLLGAGYHFSGIVKEGKGIGSDLGFATANLCETIVPVLLSQGVYGGCAYVDKTPYRAAICLGESKVFEGYKSAPIEVHIIGWDGALYGNELIVEPCYFIRPFINFETPEALIETVKQNISWVANEMPFHPSL